MKPIILADDVDPEPQPRGWVVRTTFDGNSSWAHRPGDTSTHEDKEKAHVFADHQSALDHAIEAEASWPQQEWFVEPAP